MKRLVLLGLIFTVTPAWAEDVSVRTFCRMLPRHQPDASVNYTPGVDVHGRAVAPADINKIIKNDFDAIDIPVEYNVLSSLGSLPPGSQAQPLVAMVRIYADGRVQYNGNDLTPQAQSLCSNMSQASITTGGSYYPDREPKILGQINTAP